MGDGLLGLGKGERPGDPDGQVDRFGQGTQVVLVVDLPATALVLAWKRSDAVVGGFVRVASDVVARRGSRAAS